MGPPSTTFVVFQSRNLFAVPFLTRNDCKTKSGLDKDSKKIFKFHWGKKSSINSRKNIPLGLIPTTDFLPFNSPRDPRTESWRTVCGSLGYRDF